jgi:hypothetical protein
MNKDHDYIKELFDSDGIKAPESLSEEKYKFIQKTGTSRGI